VLTGALIVAAADLVFPLLLKEGIDTALGDAQRWPLSTIAVIMLGVAGILYAGHTAMLRLEAQLLTRASYDLRRRVYAHVHAQGLQFFQRHRTGELLHRATNDVALLERSVGELAGELPFSVMLVVGIVAIMAATDPQLTLCVLGFLAAGVALTTTLGRPLPTFRKTLQSLGARLAGRMEESFVGVRTVQTFANEDYEITRLDEINREILEVDLRLRDREAVIAPLFESAHFLGVILLVWYGGRLIQAGELTVGGLVAFISYVELLTGPINRAGAFYRYIQTCRAVGERLQRLLDDRDARPPSESRRSNEHPPSLELDRIMFRYPGQSRPALDDISLTVKAAESVALVGRNGAGKSTLLDLLLRFYAPDTGRIIAGGIDLARWHMKTWRQAVGVMSQEITLFNDTVAHNIAYGKPGATRAEIEQAIRDSGAERFIGRLPGGLDFVVGERGGRLSGGERQLLALTRLFLRDPKVVLLDEPTAHLDGEALRLVGAALARLMTGRTAVLIAHRRETIRLAARIVVLDHGRVVKEGTHEALWAEQPLYRALLCAPSADLGAR
jgi:subfamily B ATP-binding cassette protein MsbA